MLDVFRAGFQRRHHDGVLIPGCQSVDNLALALEHEGDRAGFAQIAAMFAKGGPHGGGGAVAIVRHRLNNDSHATRAIAFVANFFVIIALSAHGFLDRTLDHILGHRLGLGFFYGQPQAGIFVRVRVAHLGGHSDFLGELGKQFRPRRVLTALAVLDVCPF